MKKISAVLMVLCLSAWSTSAICQTADAFSDASVLTANLLTKRLNSVKKILQLNGHHPQVVNLIVDTAFENMDADALIVSAVICVEQKLNQQSEDFNPCLKPFDVELSKQLKSVADGIAKRSEIQQKITEEYKKR